MASSLIQTKRFLGQITNPGIDYVASFASGGSQKARTEGEARDFFRRQLGQGLKGDLVFEQADNKPTLVYISCIQEASWQMFGKSFVEYAAMPGVGMKIVNGGFDNVVTTWLNQAYKANSSNTLANTLLFAPVYDTAVLGVASVAGVSMGNKMIFTQSAIPQNVTAFLVFGQSVVSQGAIWSGVTFYNPDFGQPTTATPDLALYVNVAGNLAYYSAALNTETDTGLALTNGTKYVVCLERSAGGDVNVWTDASTTAISSTSGAVQRGDFTGTALLGGYTTAGSWDGAVASYTLLSRLTTEKERVAYMAALRNSITLAYRLPIDRWSAVSAATL